MTDIKTPMVVSWRPDELGNLLCTLDTGTKIQIYQEEVDNYTWKNQPVLLANDRAFDLPWVPMSYTWHAVMDNGSLAPIRFGYGVGQRPTL